MTVQSDLIDRLGRAALECRAVIVEAHQATKDAKAATAEMRAAEKALRAAAKEAADAAIKETLAPLIERMGDEIRASQNQAIEKVFKAFDELSAPLIEAFRDMGVGMKKVKHTTTVRLPNFGAEGPRHIEMPERMRDDSR